MSEQRFKSNCSKTWKSILEYKENGELEEYSLEDDEQIEELVGVLNEQQTTIQSLKSDKAIAEDYANIFEKENVKLRKKINNYKATVLGFVWIMEQNGRISGKDDKVVKIECKNESGMINYNIWLDYDSDAITGEAVLSAMGEQISLKLDIKDPEGNPNGTLTLAAGGTSIVAKFDATVVDKSDEKSADINLEVAQDANVLFKGSVSVSENLKNKTASNIDSSEAVYDICIMTQEDFATLIQDNMYAINEWVTKISQNEILSQIFGNYGGDIIDYDDLDDDDDVDDDDDDDDENLSEDDMTLETYNGDKVTILGSLPGFECTYTCDYFIDFGVNDYSASIEYEIMDDSWYNSAEDIAGEMYIPEDDDYSTYEIVEQEMAKPLSFEDGTVYASKVHYIQKSDDWESEVTNFVFVREIKQGLYIQAYVSLYPESNMFNSTMEDLVKVISSEYYTVE